MTPKRGRPLMAMQIITVTYSVKSSADSKLSTLASQGYAVECAFLRKGKEGKTVITRILLRGVQRVHPDGDVGEGGDHVVRDGCQERPVVGPARIGRGGG